MGRDFPPPHRPTVRRIGDSDEEGSDVRPAEQRDVPRIAATLTSRTKQHAAIQLSLTGRRRPRSWARACNSPHRAAPRWS
jgi:hypothetical protein